MPRYVLRLWLPDRPGALGQVASRIGAVRGDVVGIEILERGGGRAIDELVVSLPEAGLVDLLVREVTQVDGIDVEWVHALDGAEHDPQLALLEAASRLAELSDPAVRLGALCAELQDVFAATWVVVVDRATAVTMAATGDAPPAGWILAFVEGSRHLSGQDDALGQGAEDVAWADLPGGSAAVAVGRSGRPLRARERRQLEVLARLCAAIDAPARPRSA